MTPAAKTEKIRTSKRSGRRDLRQSSANFAVGSDVRFDCPEGCPPCHRLPIFWLYPPRLTLTKQWIRLRQE